MKSRIIALPNGISSKTVFSALVFLFLLVSSITLFSSDNDSFSPRNWYWRSGDDPDRTAAEETPAPGCDLFSGNWIPDATGPSYTNASNCVIDDRQNCLKFGRPDTDFLKWRWKPNDCELPLFNAPLFFELVRGKSMAFVGDSLARNQMQSLICLLSTAVDPVEADGLDQRFRRWYFAEYNFTMAGFWAVHLVKSEDADVPGSHNLYLDEANEVWAARIQNFDYVIISAGQWFLRPLIYYQNGKIIGCSFCDIKNVTAMGAYYGYGMAFRTSFRALLGMENFKGMVFLRTISPPHFENGGWNTGGSCPRTRPLGKSEMKLDDFISEFRRTQVGELEAAENLGREKGLKFRIINPTEMMAMRPDGHPNRHGVGAAAAITNTTPADCVHWCLPGPIDTWNAVLLQLLR